MPYFLGADLGGTKTHMLVADETGRVVGFGEAGPGNHQTIGYDGMLKTLQIGLDAVLRSSGLTVNRISGAGFGIAGYDWPSEKPLMMETIDQLGLSAPYHMVNDAIPGLVAGAEDGWGIGLVSGTGCNCWGLDREHKRVGRVTGYGILMGEAAGGTELVYRAMQMVSFAWIKRGLETGLTQAFIDYVGAKDMEDLLEGYTENRYSINADAAPLVFQVAEKGDPIAREVIRWAGCELGEMVNAVARQLDFETLAFDVVLAGSMFEGGPLLTDPMRETVLKVIPKARFVRLTVPPVVGAVLIGMEQGEIVPNTHVRSRLIETARFVRQNGVRA
jgi:N-acetylglucosamine kinase-like BadF-type ATPase